MIFSKSTEYAIRATMFLCLNSSGNECFKINTIASAIDSPPFFTSKILQTLVRQNIISSTKGPNGGFYVDKKSKPIILYDLIIAVEGPDFFDKCLLGLSTCTEKNPCPLHKDFKKHKEELKQLFKKKSVSDIMTENNNGKINLKI
ncbi:MAG: Rrf2 family transcriptional regulator [Sphingobacteriales bacterium]|nr:Rrf2 family transcriptional regulator [Sphingobacteriales bacterium]